MSEGLRREVAPYGVRVVNIAPGLVATELLSVDAVGRGEEELPRLRGRGRWRFGG